MQQVRDERSLGELFSELTREISALIRQEAALARGETVAKAKQVGADAAMLAVGGALAYVGFLALVATAIIALAHVLPWWLSALIVGLLVGGTGGLLMLIGFSALRRVDPLPRETLDTLKDDANAVRSRM